MPNTQEDPIMNIDDSILNKLTDDQKKKVEAAQTPEELLALAKEAGYVLSPDQLEAVSGGWCKNCPDYKPKCALHCDRIWAP